MERIHLIMPMGGKGQRFFDNGFIIPKPLIEICGRPFFYWSAMSVIKHLPSSDITFVVLKEHIEQYNIKDAIYSYFPDAVIIELDHVLQGAVLTCLNGLNAIHDNRPILFNDCDHMFKCQKLYDLTEDEILSHDGYLITFKSDSPNYSYVETDSNGMVIRTVEKQVISNSAICGAYFFKDKNIFADNASDYLNKCSYSEYYMSGVYQCMADNGLKSGVLNTDFHISFGTPEEYFIAQARPEFGDYL